MCRIGNMHGVESHVATTTFPLFPQQQLRFVICWVPFLPILLTNFQQYSFIMQVVLTTCAVTFMVMLSSYGQTTESSTSNLIQTVATNQEHVVESNIALPEKRSRRRAAANIKAVHFYAHADTNYSSRERERFPYQVKNIPEADFVIHLGDLKGSDNCNSERPYRLVSNAYLEHAKSPVFLVPGDNDWYDCGGTTDRRRGFKMYQKYFKFFHTNFPKNWKVQHQTTRPENFSFYRRKVLFIGVHIVGGKVKDSKEWDDMLKDDLRWMKTQVEQFDRARIIVIFGHARPAKSHDIFFNGLAKIARRNKHISFIYIHGDHHRWQHQDSFRAKNIQRVMLDQGSLSDPVHVAIDVNGEEPVIDFEHRPLSKIK